MTLTLLRHAATLLLGATVSLASVAVHRSLFPLGLLLAVFTTYAVPWWLLRSSYPRTAASYVVGWLVVFALVVRGRPEGDFAIAEDVKGLALMAAGLGLVVVGLVSLTGRRPSGP